MKELAKVETPNNTKCEYRAIELDNGIRVMLIRDPTADQSAASMDCLVGQFNDPEEIPGLAHFTEHMMFLGTEKFPDEGSYASYLSDHGGSCNAFTTLENTNFSFDVCSSALDGALERFAQFFIKPLFTETATGRELLAVESEDQKGRTVDTIRFWIFLKDLADPTHPVSNFSPGNIHTLKNNPEEKGFNVRNYLFEFQRHYSSRVMSLCIYGKDSLDKLAEMAEKHFTAIPDKGITKPENTWRDHYPLDMSKTKKMYYVQSVNLHTRLHITWCVESGYSFYKSKPSRYLGFLLGHECEGSILHLLKERNWATQLIVGDTLDISSRYNYMELQAFLTPDGYTNRNEVISLIFQYIAMVSKNGFSEDVWNEVTGTSAIDYHYSDIPSPFHHVSNCSSNLNKFPCEHALSNELMTVKAPELIDHVLKSLTPDRSIIALRYSTQEKSIDIPVEANLTSRFYEDKYGVMDIPEDIIESWRNPPTIDPKLYMPLVNEFVPNSFEMVPKPVPTPRQPELIFAEPAPNYSKSDTVEVRAWHWHDDVYGNPKVQINLQIQSPASYSSPRNRALNRVYVEYLKDQTNTVSYYALMGQLSLQLRPSVDGFDLAIGGFSQKLPILLSKILEIISSSSTPSREMFETCLKTTKQSIFNRKKNQVVNHASETVAVACHMSRWSLLDIDYEIESLTYDALLSFIKLFKEHISVTLLCIGNINKPQCLDIVDIVKKKFTAGCGPMPHSFHQHNARIVKLPKGRNIIIPTATYNSDSTDSAVEVCFQIGTQSPRVIAVIDVFARVCESLFYSEMRTKEQLGYVVASSVRKYELVEGFRLVIQGQRSPWHMYSRIWCFIKALEPFIKNLSNDDLNTLINSEIERRHNKAKTLKKQLDQWWKSIETHTCEFDWTEREIDELKKLTKDDLVGFFDKYISTKSPKRRIVAALVYGSRFTEEVEALRKEWRETPGKSPIITRKRKLSERTEDLAPTSPQHTEETPQAAQLNVCDGSGLDPVTVDYVFSYGEFKLTLPTWEAWSGLHFEDP